MADSIWWTKMLHKDFCAHYCEMSDSEIVADVRRSVASLMMQRSEGSDFGALMVRMAMERIAAKHDTAVSNGMQGGRPRKDTTADGDIREDSQAKPDGSAITRNETRAHDALEPSATISAVVPTREDGKFKSDSGNAGNLESATTATIYGDDSHREAEDESANISKNMRRVPQNEAPAHGFSGGRTAQGTMSRSPEAAAQSGKDYDQGTDRRISTDEALDLLRAGVMDSSPAPTRRCSAMPSDVGEVYAFASAEGLDSADAYECWSATIARGGKTADGRKVRNWKAYVRRWCATRAEKRRTA